MANHFPSVPTDFELDNLTYNIAFPAGPAVVSGSPFYFSADVETDVLNWLTTTDQGGAIAFGFTTPGTFGSFDQDTIESAVASYVTDTVDALATASGQTVADLQADIAITRNWQWTDGSGFTVNYADTLSYP